ncbi:MAG: type IV secretory system conjugative DNA transfer family protein [Clostridia bacterium]|nr:type IV secretory system conjugative DNA transfer family protein [Clostridia bacterium]
MDKRKKILVGLLSAVILGVLLYISGILGQMFANYTAWQSTGGGWASNTSPDLPDPGFWICMKYAFTLNGLKALGIILLAAAAVVLYLRFFSDRFSSKNWDPRGFRISKEGTYGTASRMSEKEMKEDLEVTTPDKARGTILGEHKGKVVCMPVDTHFNRHIAIFGASGTMKTRAIIRNALFQSIRRGESAVITDPKGELYSDTAELFRKNGYDVKVYNLVSPTHSDSWNCMSDLNGDTLLAQVLTDVIIGNTAAGSGDGFWEDGAADLLKALILYVDRDPHRSPEEKNLSTVYKMLCSNSVATLTRMFEILPPGHPAKVPYSFFAQATDKIQAGIIMGLGTRLQVLQNTAVDNITSRNDIDLTAPAKHKCAYYIVISDRDATMAFLSSLFFSELFIKLIGYADTCPDGKCPVPVSLILDEFNNIGRLGGAADGSDFPRTLSVIRSRDIKVMLAVQSLGQLQNRYPNNLWAEIIGNCDIQLMLGCTDDVTAEYFSARSGDMSIEVDSTRVMKKTIALAQVIPQYQETMGQGKRRLLTPDEVLRLPRNEMLAIIRGHNILWLDKFDYTRHPMSKLIEKTSLMDYCPRAGAHIPSAVQVSPVLKPDKPAGGPMYDKYSKTSPGDF